MNIRCSLVCLSLLIVSVTELWSKENVQETMQVQVGARESKKVPMVLIAIKPDEHLLKDCRIISDDLEFSDHFLITVLSMGSIPHKKEIKKLEDQGYALAVFITDNRKKKNFDIHIYDIKKGLMVTDKGYIIHKQGTIERAWAHEIADLLLETLTHSKGVFCSKLAYCKQTKDGRRQVCVSDYDGTHEQAVAQAKLLIAPRWNMNDERPAILYSRYTASNVRLMEIDLITGKENVTVSYEGLNMLPAFSPITDEVVLCLSCKGGTHLYSYKYDKRKKGMNYIQLTFNNGNNISPTILDNGNIIFCSDFQGGRPQLYCLDRDKDVLTCLSDVEDICFSPVYCPVNKKVAYTKMVDGVGQLFLYNVKNQKHTQITYDQGHKQEATWSPCGNYLAFGFSTDSAKRIAIQNLATGRREFITHENDVCTYPSWSMNFTVFPAIK